MSTALILAAHGSREHADANGRVAAWADHLAETGLANCVRAAFHAVSPRFSEALDLLPDVIDEVVVVPVMTSRGYYADTVLPAALRNNRSFLVRNVTITAPVGTHSAIPTMVRRRLDELAEQYRLVLRDTTVAVVGHGTPRHAESRTATGALAAALADMRGCAEVRAAFLDEPPHVADLLLETKRDLVVLPFLIGGSHAAGDVPAAVGLQSLELPALGEVNGRMVLCDRPFGEDPAMLTLIREIAVDGHCARAPCGARA